MMKTIKGSSKKLFAMAIIFTMMFNGISVSTTNLTRALFSPATISASAASTLYVPNLNGNNYIEWWCNNPGQTYVFTTSSLRTRGSSTNKSCKSPKNYNAYIDKGDKCYIYKMTSSYTLVGYPAGNIYRYGYIKTSDVTSLKQTSKAFKSKAGNIKTYGNSDLKTSIGSIDQNDTCYLLNSINSRYQVIYSLTGSSNYKIGWISSNDYTAITKGTTGTVTGNRQRMVNKALGEVGVAERGNNNVKYNTWYYGRTINATGYAWCDAFVSWCANQSGVSTNVIPKSASVSTTLSFFRRQGRFYYSKYHGGNYTPKAGDLVFYGNNGSSHIGIVVAAPVNGYLQTVEGNVYINGKWQVYKFTNNYNRKVNSSYVYGYASPNY